MTNLFLAVFQEVNKGDLKVHNLCNSELGTVANSIRKRPLLRKSEAYVSSDIDNHNQCLDKAKPNNQSVMIRDNKTDPVANAIRKSERTVSSTEDIDEHVKGRVKIPFSEIKINVLLQQQGQEVKRLVRKYQIFFLYKENIENLNMCINLRKTDISL